jgi:hypothetical protein
MTSYTEEAQDARINKNSGIDVVLNVNSFLLHEGSHALAVSDISNLKLTLTKYTWSLLPPS